MQYQEALEWLLTRPKMQLDNGVARVKWMLEELGHPEYQVPVVHVVGTNGKGSTLNALQGMLLSAGYSVGRFTSPSILNYREQIVCQQEMISEETFANIVTSLQPFVMRLSLETSLGDISEFELLVVIFFVYVTSYHPVDIVLLEAGMGGLLDATNVASPLAVVCPSIGLDHQDFLGTSYEEIARQKVGVLKEGVPLIYASQRSDVQEVFAQKACQLHCPTYALGREFKIYSHSMSFDYHSQRLSLSGISLSMYGQHQYENAAVAIQTAELLAADFPSLDERAIRQGLAEARWPGRIEYLQDNVILDGAHNNESIRALCQFLTESYEDKTIHVLFAAIRTKPVEEMLKQLEEIASVTVTTFTDERAMLLEDYPSTYSAVSSFLQWVDTIDTTDSRHIYVITGSLYFIQEVRHYVMEK